MFIYWLQNKWSEKSAIRQFLRYWQHSKNINFNLKLKIKEFVSVTSRNLNAKILNNFCHFKSKLNWKYSITIQLKIMLPINICKFCFGRAQFTTWDSWIRRTLDLTRLVVLRPGPLTAASDAPRCNSLSTNYLFYFIKVINTWNTLNLVNGKILY